MNRLWDIQTTEYLYTKYVALCLDINDWSQRSGKKNSMFL